MQGHSHVNMSTTPSSVDTALYDQILDQLDDDMFYIFLIWNKKNDKTIKIYDMAKNVLFETSDITVSILSENESIEEFLSDAKKLVQDKPTYVTVNTTSYNNPVVNNKTTSSIYSTHSERKVKKNSSGTSNYYDDYDDDSWYSMFNRNYY